MIDKKIRNITKHDGERHYRNVIPEQHKTTQQPSPLLLKLLGQKEEKINLFDYLSKPSKDTYDNFLIFVRKYF